MATDSKHERLIYSSVRFISAVSEIYGSQRAIEAWTTIADTVDPSIKGDVFKALLSGNYSSTHVTFRHPAKDGRKVDFVKAIRNYSLQQYGLKDAVDIANKVSAGEEVYIELAPKTAERAREEFHGLGVI